MIALTSGTNPSNYGDSLAFPTTVTGDGMHGAPLGTVDFTDNEPPILDAKGVALMQVDDNDLSGDCTSSKGNNNLLSRRRPHHRGPLLQHKRIPDGDSNDLDQMVNKATPTVAVTTDNQNAIYGQTIDLTATVTGVPGGSVPGGMVSFTADGNSLGAACTNITVTKGQNNSTAVCTISVANNNLLRWSHIIVAKYTDDADYGPATSPNFTQMVGKATPTVAVTTDKPNLIYGQTIDLDGDGYWRSGR